jgi:hypothetical protein
MRLLRGPVTVPVLGAQRLIEGSSLSLQFYSYCFARRNHQALSIRIVSRLKSASSRIVRRVLLRSCLVRSVSVPVIIFFKPAVVDFVESCGGRVHFRAGFVFFSGLSGFIFVRWHVALVM